MITTNYQLDPNISWEVKGMKITDESETVCEVAIKFTLSVNDQHHVTTRLFKLDPPDPNNFIDYSNLSEDLVLNWIFDKLGQSRISMTETLIRRKYELDSAKNNNLTVKELPW